MKPTPPWTSADHLRLFLACGKPEIRSAFLAKMGIGESTLSNWLTYSDVPSTKRARARVALDEIAVAASATI